MNLSEEIRKQIEKNKGLKLAVGEINNHLSILENLVRKDIMEQVDEAYQKGLEEGKKAFDLLESERNSEYQRGLSEGNDIGYKDGVKDGQNEAWEAARKIIRMPEGNILDLFPDCYASVCTAVQAILKYDTSEAIAKLKAYEEKQKADDKIEVGDEVERYIINGSKLDSKGIYLGDTDEEGDYWNCLFWTGAVFTILAYPKRQFKRTGRHFDIASMLEDMRE